MRTTNDREIMSRNKINKNQFLKIFLNNNLAALSDFLNDRRRGAVCKIFWEYKTCYWTIKNWCFDGFFKLNIDLKASARFNKSSKSTSSNELVGIRTLICSNHRSRVLHKILHKWLCDTLIIDLLRPPQLVFPTK